MSTTPDTHVAIRQAMEQAFADWWTDFEDDHPPQHPAEAIERFMGHLADAGYEIVKQGSAPSWMKQVTITERETDVFGRVFYADGNDVRTDPLYRVCTTEGAEK